MMFASSIVSLLEVPLAYSQIHSQAATALTGLDCHQRISSTSFAPVLIRPDSGSGRIVANPEITLWLTVPSTSYPSSYFRLDGDSGGTPDSARREGENEILAA